MDEIKSWRSADIFAHPIWIGHYPGDLKELQRKTLEFLKNSEQLNSGLERDGGASSSSDPEMPHMWNEAQDFYKWCIKPSTEIWNHWSYQEPQNIQIERSWANYHPKGGWTDEHTHGSTDMVIVLYLDVPKNSGNLEIHNPLFYHWEGTKRGAASNGWRQLPVTTGDVVIFPGWILHRTGKNFNDNPRLTINTNLLSAPYPITPTNFTPKPE
tara:strand:- start:1212 stop:1847 length:636 start_codon:yes stop_codon:yes gene_type:complete